ncbi:hypothetical protein TSOC_008066 [Tetrabaena socialis]|uniref:Uncharacterized protein n=1 Tax=Tetrabaena socialis TaxID=47790 RepID=A0A2J7ZZG1_9CHLO|nr:hypothetical protein TSOC_008066 [Tetrabaena socialis]|eukprot:PNH05661.1 hypothetical protein TSOC_008066 [Tetrabaena socialis]
MKLLSQGFATAARQGREEELASQLLRCSTALFEEQHWRKDVERQLDIARMRGNVARVELAQRSIPGEGALDARARQGILRGSPDERPERPPLDWQLTPVGLGAVERPATLA